MSLALSLFVLLAGEVLGGPPMSLSAEDEVGSLWEVFSNDYVMNCLSWTHHPDNPILPPSGETWKSHWTANPDFQRFQDRLLLYYRGNGRMPGDDGNYHDRIGVAEVQDITPGTLELTDLNNGEPVIDIGECPDDFDCGMVLDPAAVIFNGKVYLYYSAIGVDGAIENWQVGCAVSEDGVHFEKKGQVKWGRCPEVVKKDGKIYLFFQIYKNDRYKTHLAVSDDGINFTDVQGDPVFQGEEGSWDKYSVVTSRIFKEGGWYYMMYGGSSYLADEPEFFGLARSKNLIDWERHPGNPIFGVAARGKPDGGAIWFPAVYEGEDHYIMIYEGSRGNYSWDLHSSICMAWIPKRPLSSN